MPIGNAPQFRGVDAVIEAYENANIPAFAVCYAKDINLRYTGDSIEEGAELLRAYLEKVKDIGSQAIYQLRLYEDLNGKSMRSNTASDMAFKFVLNERDQNYLPVAAGDKVSNSDLIKILGELADLKAENAVLKIKLDQLEDDEDSETDQEQGKHVSGAPPLQPSIGQVLVEKLAPALSVIGERIVDLIIPPPAVPGKVSGITIETGNIDEEKLIEQSVRRLRNKIPDNPGVGMVLMKLADLAEKEPNTFSFYLGILMRGN